LTLIFISKFFKLICLQKFCFILDSGWALKCCIRIHNPVRFAAGISLCFVSFLIVNTRHEGVSKSVARVELIGYGRVSLLVIRGVCLESPNVLPCSIYHIKRHFVTIVRDVVFKGPCHDIVDLLTLFIKQPPPPGSWSMEWSLFDISKMIRGKKFCDNVPLRKLCTIRFTNMKIIALKIRPTCPEYYLK
jgi:hypothetical protein